MKQKNKKGVSLMSNKKIKDKGPAKKENLALEFLDNKSNSLDNADVHFILERLSTVESQLNIIVDDNNTLKNQLVKKDSYILDLEAKIESYKSSINHLQSLLYGKKSEKLKNILDETPLFDAMNCTVESIQDENSFQDQEQNTSEYDRTTQDNQTTTTSRKKKE